MKTRSQIYEKYGETAEAAQLLETEIGNFILKSEAEEHNLLENIDRLKAKEIFDKINHSTLGQLLKKFNNDESSDDELINALSSALASRNRLSHSFYREHNFRINSDEGRVIMYEDLDYIHSQLLNAYKKLLLICGIDLDNVAMDIPTKHLNIK